MSRYWIQRANFSDHIGVITGFDQLIKYDYMGRSEFEGNRLNEFLRRMILKNLKIFSTQYKSNAGRGLFIITDEQNIDRVKNDILEDLILGKDEAEPSYIWKSLNDDQFGKVCPKLFGRFECWIDIHNDAIFCLGKKNAARLVKGITAYRNRINNVQSEIRKFVIFWLDGTKTECEGINEKDAFIKSGCGGGAINAVDFICPKEDSSDYSWNSVTKSWEQISIDK